MTSSRTDSTSRSAASKYLATSVAAFGTRITLTARVPTTNLSILSCRKHDIDYATCNKPKEVSDRQFLKCIYNKIQQDRLNSLVSSLRLIAAQGYYAAVDIFGCESWVQSQMNSCVCIRPLSRRKKRPNYETLNYHKYEFI